MHVELNGKGIELKLSVKAQCAAEQKASAVYGKRVSIPELVTSQMLTDKVILIWAAMLHQKRDAVIKDAEDLCEEIGLGKFSETVGEIVKEAYPEYFEGDDDDESEASEASDKNEASDKKAAAENPTNP